MARREARAVGGLSMGGHGALQLSLNFADVFGVAGAHSPTLRREDQALAFFAKGADFAARDPASLVRADPGSPPAACLVGLTCYGHVAKTRFGATAFP